MAGPLLEAERGGERGEGGGDAHDMTDLPLEDLALALTPSTAKSSEFSQVSRKAGWLNSWEGGLQWETLGSNKEKGAAG